MIKILIFFQVASSFIYNQVNFESVSFHFEKKLIFYLNIQLMLNIGNMSGSIFMNFFLLCVIEAPGYYLGIWISVFLLKILKKKAHLVDGYRQIFRQIIYMNNWN